MRPETLAIHAGGDTTRLPVRSPRRSISPPPSARPRRRTPRRLRVPARGQPDQRPPVPALATLEACTRAAFASGMAAQSGLLESLAPGTRVLAPDDCYTGLRLLGEDSAGAWRGLQQGRHERPRCRAHAAAAGVDLLWVETPSNPRMKISESARWPHRPRAWRPAVVRQHLRHPLLTQPLALGADVVDAFDHQVFRRPQRRARWRIGVRARRCLRRRVAHRLHITGRCAGTVQRVADPARLPFAACRHGDALRECTQGRRFLASRTKSTVNIPAWLAPRHDVPCARCATGGMLSIEMRGGRAAALAVAGRLHLFTNATSLGGCESLVEHRASVEGAQPTSPQNLLRLSVGLEHIDDLLADLAHALG